MNKIIFVGVGIAIILLIIGVSSITSNTSIPNQESDVGIEVSTEVSTEGKDLIISFSDGISAQGP